MSYSDSFIKLFLEVLGLIQIDYSIISINKFGWTQEGSDK